MLSHWRVLTCWILLTNAALLLQAAENSSPQADQNDAATLFLITDYLPHAIYERDPVTACFRVESVSGSTTASLEMRAFTADKILRQQSETLAIPASGFATCQFTQDSRNCDRLTFTLTHAGQTVKTVAVRLLRENEPWPNTQFKNGRLETAPAGEVLIPLATKRTRIEDRAFKPLKWLESSKPAHAPAKKTAGVVALPGRWNFSKQNFQAGAVFLGPFPADGALPILRALDQLLSDEALNRASGTGDAAEAVNLVLCLPPEDLDTATAPRTYRCMLDFLFGHLATKPVGSIALVPPLHYGISHKQQSMLWREVREAASVYRVQVLDPVDFLHETLWRCDPEKEGVYGIRPNREGIKKIEQALIHLLP